MPLTIVQRRATTTVAADLGTQVVEGTLTLADPTYIEFDPTLFTGPGTYTLFTYGQLVGDVSYLRADGLDATGLALSGPGFESTGPTNGAITVTLA